METIDGVYYVFLSFCRLVSFLTSPPDTYKYTAAQTIDWICFDETC